MGLMSWVKELRNPTMELADDDVVVFVVGPSGAGKSLFVEEVTRSGLVKVGGNLRPCTTKVQAIRCELTERARKALGPGTQQHIVFVDTPSFHTGQNDGAAEKVMRSWLSKSKSKSTLTGIIYMHRVATDPSHEPIQPHLKTFAYTFPPDFSSLPQRLHAVLRYEGVISEDTIQRRTAEFQAQLVSLRSSLGGTMNWVTSSHPTLFHWQPGDPDAAWQIVVALFAPTKA